MFSWNFSQVARAKLKNSWWWWNEMMMMMKLCLKFQFFVLHKDLNKKWDGKSISYEIWVTTCRQKKISTFSQFLFPEGFLKDGQSVKSEIWDGAKSTNQNTEIAEPDDDEMFFQGLQILRNFIF